jgi:hypothetical protein
MSKRSGQHRHRSSEHDLGQVIVGTPETLGRPEGLYLDERLVPTGVPESPPGWGQLGGPSVATPLPQRGKRLERVIDVPQLGKQGEHRDRETGGWYRPPLETWHPRPADVVDLRATLARAWEPGGELERISPVLLQPGACGPPPWERLALTEAALWWVSEPMCDLLEGAAPAMPPVELAPDLVPDKTGFVVFQRCLEGIDADGSEAPVTVGAMLWGPAYWRPAPGEEQVPVLGITVYRPVPLVDVPMCPIGSLVWPLGMPPDASLTAEGAKDASMAEDRRRLAALWVLSAQRELVTTTEAPLPRQVVRRATRSGQEPPKVRVVHLRGRATERGPGEPTGHHLHHRFIVSGHWKQVAFGPGHSQRYPKWIEAYPKGPEGAPLLKRSTVKAWDR